MVDIYQPQLVTSKFAEAEYSLGLGPLDDGTKV